jgi:hypothetical protein
LIREYSPGAHEFYELSIPDIFANSASNSPPLSVTTSAGALNLVTIALVKASLVSEGFFDFIGMTSTYLLSQGGENPVKPIIADHEPEFGGPRAGPKILRINSLFQHRVIHLLFPNIE